MRTTQQLRAVEIFEPALFTRQDMRDAGLTRRGLEAALRAGRLVRVRRDRYVKSGHSPELAFAARVGGRVTCLTLLRMLGVFVLRGRGLHVQVPRGRSRFDPPREPGVRVHWVRSRSRDFFHVTTIAEAVQHALRCQEPRASVATLDSLLNSGLMTMDEIEALFARLPHRFAPLLRLVDGSAESGPETFVRLMLRALGVSFATQVAITGVGRVDFVVEGWLIIECDSKEFHEGWEKQKHDRRRDMAAAELGYVTIRPLASDILYESHTVQRSIAAVIAAFSGRGATRR